MSSVLSPSGLKTHDYTDSAWWTDENSNITLLQTTLLKVSGMGDVTLSGLADGDGLQYESATSKFVNVTTLS